jgi:hypothetical protein
MTTAALSLTGTERRRRIGLVGVDAGTMAIAGNVRDFPPGLDWWDEQGARHNVAHSTTGYGDGGYDVFEVVAEGGEVRGLEVVFMSPSLEAKVTKTDDMSWDEHSRLFNDLFDEMVPAIDPASESQSCVLGSLSVGGQVGVGDPCYGGPSLTHELPAGEYVAVAWRVGTKSLGERVARLGIYRSDGGA